MLQDAANKYEFTLETHSGEKESITYRLPSLRGMSEYLTLQMDDAALLTWLCEWKDADGKPDQDRVDRYTIESIFAMLEEVKERMDPKIAVWLKRQAAKREKLRELNESLSSTSGKTSQPTSTPRQEEDLSKYSISPRPSASAS